MGDRPSPQHSLERINNDGDYCPENCKWATRKEQYANRRTTVYIETPSGKMMLKEACGMYDVSYKSLTAKVCLYTLSHQELFNEVILRKGNW